MKDKVEGLRRKYQNFRKGEEDPFTVRREAMLVFEEAKKSGRHEIMIEVEDMLMDLEFIDRVEFELHVYSLSELCNLLSKAGWETTATYGNLATLQPRTPLSSLNIVAKAQ